MYRRHSLAGAETTPVSWDEAVTTQAAVSWQPTRITPDEATAARAFYCDALRGRQVSPIRRAVDGRSLWFRIGGTLVEARPDRPDTASPLVLGVDDPLGLAERCWNAGFSVRVSEDDDEVDRMLLSVFDPFGRQIDLIQCCNEVPAARCG